MMVIDKIKKNKFFVIVLLSYIVMTIVSPSLGQQSVKNSAYYIKEMLLIMPVIFILTALLDTWVPRDRIEKYLGRDAKAKGVFLSFVIGSISAGPIYAAFPMCIMLHKKGASIRNIIIILSSWAVIKIPMLINEAKFLGPRFMAWRWVLTIVAIIIFSWIADKIVKEEDLPEEEEIIMDKVTLDKDACIGCGLCVATYPELFQMDGSKAYVVEREEGAELDMDRLQTAIDDCPVSAIEYHGE